MIQLTLLELVKKQVPNLNYDNADDIIKAEKILKAEAKLNPAVKINDIENLLSFLKAHKGKFIPIIQNKNVAIMVGEKTGRINFARLNRENISDDTLAEFQEVFATNIRDFLKQNVRDGDWSTLRSVFLNYDCLVAPELQEELCESFSTKNQALISAIHRNEAASFVKTNSFSVDESYFYLLSTAAPGYFDNEILQINNAISERQHTDAATKHYLGKILYAATFFDAFNDNLKSTLADNQQVALGWIYPRLQNQSGNSTLSNIVTIVVGIALFFICVIIIIATGFTAVAPMIIVAGIAIRIFRAVNRS